ncbi:alpha/beta hydrolase fold family protein [Collimonas fungivorans]|uniref:Alpha/beta hydrolase fold family protein n=1 Tax=Collimonas fungivorans TaxID=158899 RepID=A0A127PFT2_9BURK|nr:alpha/beta hydrolase [Collimonas fungivorans]AMO96575.1 alpha/beta hydrolase fold family protein [Collimonas fungivorans]
MNQVRNKKIAVDGIEVFYREAGSRSKPTLLLLHGFPSSSHMFRDLFPLLMDQFHLVAPDLPGFGQTELLSRDKFAYTFENLANVIARFTEILELDRFGIYVFDYGAPVGWRLAAKYPERVTSVITQNGNAYAEGLSDGWNPIRKYWQEPNQMNRDALRELLKPEATLWQYTHGVANVETVSPDGYSLDDFYMARPGAHEVQLDLFLDYASNVALYPEFQACFRKHQPAVLAVWGRNDPFFLPAGAEAFKRDVKNARIVFYDTGHFALETHAVEIAEEIHRFLGVPKTAAT